MIILIDIIEMRGPYRPAHLLGGSVRRRTNFALLDISIDVFHNLKFGLYLSMFLSFRLSGQQTPGFS
jgi:hypothetical protein